MSVTRPCMLAGPMLRQRSSCNRDGSGVCARKGMQSSINAINSSQTLVCFMALSPICMVDAHFVLNYGTDCNKNATMHAKAKEVAEANSRCSFLHHRLVHGYSDSTPGRDRHGLLAYAGGRQHSRAHGGGYSRISRGPLAQRRARPAGAGGGGDHGTAART